MEELIRMQDNLLLIRRAVGWTADEFGDKIGVTRQTINNIENKRNRLTKTVYIAMRSVLDAEIIQSPEDTEMLRLLLDVLVDHPDNYSDADKNEIIAKANLMAPSIMAGTASRNAVSKEVIQSIGRSIGFSVMGAIPIVGAMAGHAVSVWLQKAIEVKGEKK